MPDTTEPGHGAFAHRAVNPVDKAMLLCAALRDLDAARGTRVHHPALDTAIGRSTNLMITHISAGSPRVLTRLSRDCVIGAALSFPPPETLESVQREVSGAIAEACRADPHLSAHPPRICWDSGVSSAETDSAHPLFLIAAQAIQACTGDTAHVNALHTSSDIRNPIVQKGIPTIGLGPLCGDLSQNGGHDEWVDVEDYLRSVKVAASIVAGWCGLDRPADTSGT